MSHLLLLLSQAVGLVLAVSSLVFTFQAFRYFEGSTLAFILCFAAGTVVVACWMYLVVDPISEWHHKRTAAGPGHLDAKI